MIALRRFVDDYARRYNLCDRNVYYDSNSGAHRGSVLQRLVKMCGLIDGFTRSFAA